MARSVRRVAASRTAALLLAGLVAAGCAGASSASSSPSPPAPSSEPGASAPSDLARSEPTAVFEARLRAAGAEVRTTGDFTTEPLGGKGVRLCVAGQEVSVYVYETAAERAAVAARIDPNDPSKLGTSIVEWVGNPRFWEMDRLIVLYLGSDPVVESGITSILGPPFARGRGGVAAPNHSC